MLRNKVTLFTKLKKNIALDINLTKKTKPTKNNDADIFTDKTKIQMKKVIWKFSFY